MQFKSIFRDLKGKNGKHKKPEPPTEKKNRLDHRHFHSTPEESSSSSYLLGEQSPWASMPTELLLDIIGRVEASETIWPARRAVLSCAAVCKSWREVTREIVRTPEECGLLTFPISLKQVNLISFVMHRMSPVLFIITLFLTLESMY